MDLSWHNVPESNIDGSHPDIQLSDRYNLVRNAVCRFQLGCCYSHLFLRYRLDFVG